MSRSFRSGLEKPINGTRHIARGLDALAERVIAARELMKINANSRARRNVQVRNAERPKHAQDIYREAFSHTF